MATKKKAATPKDVQDFAEEMLDRFGVKHDDDGEVEIKIVSGPKQKQILEHFEEVVQPGRNDQEVPPAESPQQMFDHLQHLTYVFDASISMGEGLPDEEQLKAWMWPAAKLTAARALMAKLEKDANAALGGDPDDDDDDDDYFDDDDDEPVVADLSDDDVKLYILENAKTLDWQTIDFQGIHFKRNPMYKAPNFRTKMQAVKDGASDMVSARFRKFSDAKVSVQMFSDSPETLVQHGADERTVLNAIASMPDRGIGGTDIYRAVVAALREFKRNPADVPAHHIILVSDGCDPGAERLDGHIAEMKDLGVVFDFIYIEGDTFMLHAGDRTIATLKKICEATGGEFVVVKTAKDFVEKLLAASNRPMLPAPR